MKHTCEMYWGKQFEAVHKQPHRSKPQDEKHWTLCTKSSVKPKLRMTSSPIEEIIIMKGNLQMLSKESPSKIEFKK
jgi:hypothetical protein